MSSNDPYEDRLRQVLLAEAQTVTPAGDGLSQILAKVARRQARLRWLRPGLAVVTAAALAGAAVFAFALGEPATTATGPRHDRRRPPVGSGRAARAVPAGPDLRSGLRTGQCHDRLAGHRSLHGTGQRSRHRGGPHRLRRG